MGEHEQGLRVWIDQDLCTGDGLCEELAPEVFTAQDDGLYYVKEMHQNFADVDGNVKIFNGDDAPEGAKGLARIPEGMLEAVIEAAEECPGECIFLEPVEE